jgi:predicted TIM-barrel fold metal-dependent hydrolase
MPHGRQSGATSVIDVDSHFEIAVSPDDHPLRDLRHLVPSSEEFLADSLFGDLLTATPPDDRPALGTLVACAPDPNMSSMEYATFTGGPQPRFASMDPAERLAWMDGAGIDISFMNPGTIGIIAGVMREERGKATRASNDFVAAYVDGHTDRLVPVTLLDWNDLDGVVAELTRMRALGSRAFWVRAEPYGGMSPAHPEWDRVWSAATDLGMVAILHVGSTPTYFEGGWGNAGWHLPGGGGDFGFARLAHHMRHQTAELMLASMIYGGVFGRHPNLTVIIEELGVSWLPHFVRRCEGLTKAGEWPFETSPPEMARRNIRSVPLPGVGDPLPFQGVLAPVSDMLLFSSDYPHGEGNADPIALFDSVLRTVDEQTRDWFLGGNIADCFARMGDPLG